MPDVAIRRVGARRIEARVAGLFRTEANGFETVSIESLNLGFDGIAGDRHGGPTRRTGGREPWYPRGTEIRNERQVSILCPDELAGVADAMRLPELRPEWIGGNLLLAGVPHLSWLPARTLMMFENGASLKVEGDNAPCRQSGRSVAARFSGRDDIETGFVQAARRRRGLVAWVEKPGALRLGERVDIRLPEQWIYEG
ncbi:MOSC domain-containing protein [Aureimonas jatrophae]|uniref:MOSC domain-containing protein n=1 Tax=Aureimonas jatrophae TaxID=1166073 RepID=A0A1H0CBT6_9HYPH|nr:molybdenum cofactor sulfurase [Aureimonas jatrophae]MBB3949164.1 hypothetical protein [Aureimonas jatrophae]SDN55374.1 hypothetical protein SAMN05192530_101236 [Aureimonas jatrophae]